MIEAKETLTGNITSKQTISGEMNVATEFISPPLIDLEITPTKEQQVFTHENSYGYDKVTVEPYTPNVNTKTITANGTYNASDDNLDGYSSVEVATSGVDINDYFAGTPKTGNSSVNGISTIIKKVPNFTSLPTDISYLFANCSSLEEIPNMDTSKVVTMYGTFQNCSSITTIPLLNTSKVKNMRTLFSGCTNLTTIPQLDTGIVTNMNNMFSDSGITEIPLLNTYNVQDMGGMFIRAKKIKTIPQLDTHNVTTMNQMFYGDGVLEEVPSLNTVKVATMNQTFYAQSKLHTVGMLDGTALVNILNMFYGCKSLINFGGIKDLGKAYATTVSQNNSQCTLNLNDATLLTHDCLMNVINNLYDIKTKGCKTQTLVLGATNLAKLTSEEIAIATDKGWTVS